MKKLRIIAGEFGGRLIKSTDNSVTHPMGNRVRSALFAKILSRKNLDGAHVLDVFAGTGAIGLEAISRGAASVEFVENNYAAAKIIRENIAILGVENRADLAKMSAKTWLENYKKNGNRAKFDIVFVDPPYGKLAEFREIVGELVENACAPGGFVILSWRSGESLPNPERVVVVALESYGEATLAFYRKIDD